MKSFARILRVSGTMLLSFFLINVTLAQEGNVDQTPIMISSLPYTTTDDPVIYDNNIIYVNKNVIGGDGSGSSWENALLELADALKYAKENEATWSANMDSLQIFVAKGTYKPLYSPEDGNFGNDAGRDNTFLMVNNVQLYGGFDGTEAAPADRDLSVVENETVLSGDLNDDDQITGSGGTLDITNNGENNYHVVVSLGAVGTAVLDGFTITGGNANSDSADDLVVNGWNLNRVQGGGMYNVSSSPSLTNVTMSGNSASYGGGMYNRDSSSPSLTNVTLSGNSASNSGGGMYSYISSPSLTNVTMSGNSASYGGGMYNANSSPSLTNVTLSGNSASYYGGGMCNSEGSSPSLTNVTLSGNSASYYGGGMYNYSSSPSLTNIILWGNTAGTSGDGIANNTSSSPVISYSLVQDIDNTAGNGLDGTDAANDPQFTDAGNGDYSLQSTSPAINAGSNTAYTDAGGDLENDVDLAGNPRLFGDIIDMGAYEFTGEIIWECPDIQANIGDACDDDDPDTDNDTITEDCDCVGTPIVVWECPDLEANIGDPCDDDDPDTDNDTITEDCGCEGTPISACVADAGTLQFGEGGEEMTFCADDGIPSTISPAFSEEPTTDLPFRWVATDTEGNVMKYSNDLSAVESFDFDQWGVGTYLIRALSYHPGASNALDLRDDFKDGEDVNISDLTGCFEFSNSIAFIGESCIDAGCYASEVLDFYQGPQTDGNPVAGDRSDPETALGEPDRSNAPGGFVSLGVGGYITLAFDGIIVDQPGNDIRIWETSYSGDECSGPNDEHADIELSIDGVNFTYVGTICRDGEVDMADAGFSFVSAIRITNADNTATLDGYDVDGVEAIHGCEEPFTPGACYAGNIMEYIEGVNNTGGPIAANRTNPEQALGEPERTDDLVFVSLGYGGSIVLEFNGAVPNGPGDDLEIVETTYNFTSCSAYPEYADVYVSLDGSDWHFAKTVCQEDPFVDISDAGDFTHINYVKIENNDELTTTLDGFDVDGVAVLHCYFHDAPTPARTLVEKRGVLTSHPNPTSGLSQVVFSTPTDGRTIVEVYDMNGRSVATLFNEVSQANRQYRLDFNGGGLPNGIYIYRMTTEHEIIIDKFMIAK